jgi:hypothetical protein
MYVRKYTTVEQLLHQIGESFKWVESMDLRVGDLYLNPNDVRLIGKDLNLDRIASWQVKAAFPGLVGVLFGVRVFESDIVPEEHIALIPDGIEGKLVDSAACIAL